MISLHSLLHWKQSGFTFGTFVVEQKYYMKYLSDRLASKGVSFVQERVDCLDRLARTGRFDCVVNCTGLGAMEAAADPSMYPIRGQVLRVRLARTETMAIIK